MIGKVPLCAFLHGNHNLLQGTQCAHKPIHAKPIEAHKHHACQNRQLRVAVIRCHHHYAHDDAVAQRIAEHDNHHPAAEGAACEKLAHPADGNGNPCIAEKAFIFQLPCNGKQIIQQNCRRHQIQHAQNGRENVIPEQHRSLPYGIHKGMRRKACNTAKKCHQKEMHLVIQTVYHAKLNFTAPLRLPCHPHQIDDGKQHP